MGCRFTFYSLFMDIQNSFVHAAVTLDYYSPELGLLERKREYDRKDRRIVDRKPEENEKFW